LTFYIKNIADYPNTNLSKVHFLYILHNIFPYSLHLIIHVLSLTESVW